MALTLADAVHRFGWDVTAALNDPSSIGEPDDPQRTSVVNLIGDADRVGARAGRCPRRWPSAAIAPGAVPGTGRVADAGVRPGGSLPGRVHAEPASEPTLSPLRTRPRRGLGRLEGYGPAAGSGGACTVPDTANRESQDRSVGKTP